MRRLATALAVLVPSLLCAQPQSPGAQTEDPGRAAAAAYASKDYATCGALYEKIASQPTGAAALFDAARCWALAGKPDPAITALQDLVRRGWTNGRRVRDEADFASLRGDRRWQAILSGVDANWDRSYGDCNRELWAIMEADQKDRQSLDTDVTQAIGRDRERRARVAEILAAGGVKTSMDYFNAALILQHGESAANYQKARDLALKSVELEPANARARWLAAAALDRYLVKTGKPQLYGTQFRQVNGVWMLEPVDEAAMTDEERAKWNVPPLADMKKRVAALNTKR